MPAVKSFAVAGSFDNLHSSQVRFLEAAAAYGNVHVLLYADEAALAREGRSPRFPFAERRYLLEALRYVHRVWPVTTPGDAGALPELPEFAPDGWIVDEAGDTPGRRASCDARGLAYHVVSSAHLPTFPSSPPLAVEAVPGRKRVIVTGCFDWLHSGHVRFFEEASELGELYVVVGHDANVRLLKGEGHPMQSEAERRYMVHAIRFVKQGLVSSGHGWMDAEPEIVRLRPDYYVVNEDGDKPEKREFCALHGLEYVVLKRVPKQGLTRRSSTDLRGY